MYIFNLLGLIGIILKKLSLNSSQSPVGSPQLSNIHLFIHSLMFLFGSYYVELTFGTVLGLVMHVVEQIKSNSFS